MNFFTERHGMRAPKEMTSIIDSLKYSLIFDCCTRYYDNIAWKYPLECEDGYGCCGLDMEKFSNSLWFEIPNLFRNSSMQIAKPQNPVDPFFEDQFDQYALLDLVELIAQNCKDLSAKVWHQFHWHHDLHFAETRNVFEEFHRDINDTFEKTGLLYTLTTSGTIERIEINSVLDDQVMQEVEQVSEIGLKELIQDALFRHRQPHPSSHRDAVEKIWDAFERLKSFYIMFDKKKSSMQIVNDIAGYQNDFVALLNEEFKRLTDIGNNFRIRHHETDKIEIIDDKHIDYFFNRCLSLVALSIQYLK